MNAKVEKAGGTNALDMVKLALAVVLLVAGIVAYYYFGGWNGWARVGMVALGLIAAAPWLRSPGRDAQRANT